MADSKQTSVVLEPFETSGSMTHPNVGSDEVYTSDDGEFVAVHQEAEGVEGRAQARIINEGRDLELVGAMVTLSEGSENARVYMEVGYNRVPTGTASTKDRVINKLGPGSQSGGYSRESETYQFPSDGRPKVPENDSLFVTVNGDTAGTGDTFKVFWTLWFRPTGSESRL